MKRREEMEAEEPRRYTVDITPTIVDGKRLKLGLKEDKKFSDKYIVASVVPNSCAARAGVK